MKHDLHSQNLSLHRLVQSEALFRMLESERQDAFEGAVKLLLDKFPKRELSTGQRREEGDQLLPHISSLARNWKDSQTKQEPLKPTVDFCNLLADCAR